MSEPVTVTARPAICLNMIVRNEAHIVQEALDAAAPYISSWAIVDTGSNDGTQNVIRKHMAQLGISGELYERPWRNFGHNRTEALTLAQGHGDYIWVLDADDTVAGTPDFTHLDADIYLLRRRIGAMVYWRPELLRDGLPARWVGATHEYFATDTPHVRVRLEGDYHIEDRQLSARNVAGQKLAQDRDLLLAEVERNPRDARSVFYLAQSYFALGDFVSARTWYARRVEMGGWDEEIYYSMCRVAESMANLGAPWPGVQDAYLRAWNFRPTRAEPLYAVARRNREDQRYRLGYLFAQHAAEIPFPERDVLFVRSDVYAWRATDEQAVCAFLIGKHAEAFTLWRRLLARADIPDGDRQRVASNRDVCVPSMIEAASSFPDALVHSLIADARDAEVVVSLIAGPDRGATEQTLNSFLHCCMDVSKVERFLVVAAGLADEDRAILLERYGFLEFVPPGPGNGLGAQLAQIRAHLHGRFWLHLGQGWRFFAPENLITRLTAVLDAEAQVFQVGINFADAVKLTGACADEQAVRRAPHAGRYVLTDGVASGPAMFDIVRLDRAGGIAGTVADPTAVGRCTATLDEVLCITLPSEQRSKEPKVEVDATYDAHIKGQLDLRVAEQLELADRLGPKWPEFSKSWSRYTPTNDWFGLSDGAVYYSILTTLRPKRIVEVGSGFTSAIALDVRDQELHDLKLTFIDPDPARLLGRLKESDHTTTTVHRDIVQKVAIEVFDALQKDDILFIDSSHVSKRGSDVNWLFFRVLPRLRPGVVVHFHDIFFPFEYPDAWLNCSFNEMYLLRAFLSYNNVFQIMFFNSWFWREHPKIVRRYFPEGAEVLPGSIWLRRVGG